MSTRCQPLRVIKNALIKRVDQTTRVSCADRARSICKEKEMPGSYFDHTGGWLAG